MSAVLSIILIVIAAIVAFFIGRWDGLSRGTQELSEKLESKDKELDELKSGVNEHFDETARLFSNLTEEYKTLYQHLATGANKLSERDFKVKLSAPVGAEALPTEASAAEVIDAEEHLAGEELKTDNNDDNQSHEEENFIRDTGDKPSEETTEAEPKNPNDAERPDLDIEVSPPKDWADDDMNDDHQPNDSRPKESEFTDLADENAEKPSAINNESDDLTRKDNPETEQKEHDKTNS